MKLFLKNKEADRERKQQEDKISDCRYWTLICDYLLNEFKNRSHVRYSIYQFTYPATAFLLERYSPDVIIKEIKKYNCLRNDDIRTLTLMLNVSQMEIELRNENN